MGGDRLVDDFILAFVIFRYLTFMRMHLSSHMEKLEEVDLASGV